MIPIRGRKHVRDFYRVFDYDVTDVKLNDPH